MEILVAGDFCPQDRTIDLVEKGNFQPILGQVKNIISDVDYSIVNFECPVVEGGEKPIDKCGPNLSCSPKGIEAVRWAGFNCVTLANNHYLDYGESGALTTIAACNRLGIDYVGGGKNINEASQILFKEIKGTILAIINCCEHEFSIATDTSAGSNPLNPIKQYESILTARRKADYVLIVVHGGNEYYSLPSPRMQETYRFFIDVGADAVVNHHQHCYSGYEVYKGKPIFYGIGNLCFDNPKYRQNIWNSGYLVKLSFCEDKINFNLYPYIQCDDEPTVRFMTTEETKQFGELINKFNQVIQDIDCLKKEYDCFLDLSKREIMNLLEPYSGRVLELFKRGLLPRLLNKGKKIEMLAYVQCESHLPKIINYLRKC